MTTEANNEMTRAAFVGDVRAEIKHIKKVATSYELRRLDFLKFNENYGDKCIYGQMTGDCTSWRAKEIMPKKYFTIIKDSATSKNMKSFESQDLSGGGSFTALEKYLFISDKATHEHIIDFLKGKVNKLVIK